jgi:iron complex outermembrane receptor protein
MAKKCLRHKGAAMSSTIAAMAFGAFAVGSAPAQASLSPQERSGVVMVYDIPAGPVASALNAFAVKNGLHLLYEARVTRMLRTTGLVGSFSIREGLDQLLDGTGLTYRFGGPDEKAVSIILAQNDTGVRSDAGGAEQLPTIDIGAEQRRPAARAGEKGEPKIASEGYVVHEASTATKGDIPIRQTPVTVNVVPKQVIRDQAITNLQSVLENVPGVRSNSTDFAGYLYKVRGFNVLDTYRNQLNQGNANFFTDVANIERVEVLKGPASILYGRADPGGLINIVTKQPLFTPRYVVEQQIGNYDHYRTQWDLSAPVEQVPGLAYRVSGAYQNSGGFRQFQHGERFLIAPVVTYQPTTWTEITADLQYLSNDVNLLTGIPTLPNASAPANVPLSRTYQESNAPHGGTDAFVGSFLFRQNLDENWKIVNRFLYSSTWSQQNFIAPAGYVDAVTLNRVTQAQNISAETFSTNINLEGKFETLGAKHIFLFGLDYMNKNFDYYYGGGTQSYPISVFGPVYGTVPSGAYYDALIGSNGNGAYSNLIRQKGMYVQDHISFLEDRAHLMLGVRYDIADVTSGNSESGGDYSASKWAAIQNRLSHPSFQDKAWSPRFGVVYDLLPEVSVYGSYTRSFGPNNSSLVQVLPPEIGTQWEVGLKAQPLPDLSATLSFFQLTKSNLTTPNLATPNPNDVTLAGLQRSRGVELEILGRLNERLAVMANYANIDAKVIAHNSRDPLKPYGSGLLGNHLENVPRHSGKVWLTYDFGDAGLGWRVGGGVTAASHAWGDIQNTFLIPSFTRLDAMASYSTLYDGHKLTAQLNLNNITNARYFTGTDIYFNSAARVSAFPAPPFTVVGTLKFEW